MHTYLLKPCIVAADGTNFSTQKRILIDKEKINKTLNEGKLSENIRIIRYFQRKSDAQISRYAKHMSNRILSSQSKTAIKYSKCVPHLNKNIWRI